MTEDMTWEDVRNIQRKVEMEHHPTEGIDPDTYMFRKGKFSRPEPTPYKEALKEDPEYILWADREWDDFRLTRGEYIRVRDIVRGHNRERRKRKEQAAFRRGGSVWD